MGASRSDPCLCGATVMEGRGWRDVGRVEEVTSEGYAKALWKKKLGHILRQE